MTQAIEWILGIEKHLPELVAAHGVWVYAIIGGILFGETGLVVLAFLPGDTLLFACGVTAAAMMPDGSGTVMNLWILLSVLPLCAILGDSTNYWIGRGLRRVMERRGKIPGISAEAIAKAHQFFEKYGGWGVALGRWVPLIRSVVPLTAGLIQMTYRRFLFFSVIGNFIWVAVFTLLGFFLGKIPIVRDNFGTVSLVLIAIILFAITMHFVRQLFRTKKAAAPAGSTPTPVAGPPEHP